jgi:hypothetical protein
MSAPSSRARSANLRLSAGEPDLARAEAGEDPVRSVRDGVERLCVRDHAEDEVRCRRDVAGGIV